MAAIRALRNQLKQWRKNLKSRFESGEDIQQLLQSHCETIDKLVLQLWQAYQLNLDDDICLIAIGGYGRQECHPHSDLDLLVLSAKELNDNQKAQIEKFVMSLWDIGFEAGHSVRTLGQCIEVSHNDITIMTSLLEARLLQGNDVLFERFREAHSTEQMWPSKAFYEAKKKEQAARYLKYDETSYNLEPNVKHGPGGLRDIHTIFWIAKRHFKKQSLRDLVRLDFVSKNEFKLLQEGLQFLWRITFALHFLKDKRESRLLFDNQMAIAKQFGYQDDEHALAIEYFMRDYYLKIKSLRELNDMLMELLNEVIVWRGKENVVALDEEFQVCNDYIDVIDDELFKKRPKALLKLFLILGQQPHIRGIRARTIRLIHANSHLIDEDFRQDEQSRQLFISIFKLSGNLSTPLQLMNRYQLLGKYIPAFGKIIGLSQYDLYHAYTVDQHTIFLIRNIERFSQVEFRAQFSLCAEIMANLPKHVTLLLAAFFHDIAKGQGGDHSTLGAEESKRFCHRHYISEEEGDLVAWLVQNHLLMSQTAQRKDISDPETIEAFTELVKDQTHLDHLYLLTVADICATNPSLWNSWRDSLLKELYLASRQYLSEQDKHRDDDQVIMDKKLSALEYLKEKDMTDNEVEALWQHFKKSYFLRETARNIAWHTESIYNHGNNEKPLVMTKQHYLQAATEVFTYTPLKDNYFLIASTVLANNHVNIVEARIARTTDQYLLLTYVILDEKNKPIDSPDRLGYIRHSIMKHYLAGKLIRLSQRRLSKRARHFSVTTRVVFTPDYHRDRTIIRVVSADRPGLLARFAKVFHDNDTIVHSAKISTMGERVEDIFFVTDNQNKPIHSKTQQETLREQICKAAPNQ